MAIRLTHLKRPCLTRHCWDYLRLLNFFLRVLDPAERLIKYPRRAIFQRGFGGGRGLTLAIFLCLCSGMLQVSDAQQLTAGLHHNCALLNGGSVKCWGHNSSGQLGLGDTANRGDGPVEMGNLLPPVDLGTGRTAAAVTGGNLHACALLDDNSVKCWGNNSFSAQLGLGDRLNRGDDPNEMGDHLPPIDLGTGRTAVAIVGGANHTCALLDDGSLKCWGGNQFGQLGQGDTATRGDEPDEMGDHLLPIGLGTGRTAIAVAAGSLHTCALLDNGSVKCWGWNDWGQLGLGDPADRGDEPDEMGDHLPSVDLGTSRTAIAIDTGGDVTCAILDDASVKCWGWNGDGNLGLGDIVIRGDDPNEMGDNLPPVDLGTGRSAVAVSLGSFHVCALLNAGSVKCWGENNSGQLGRGDTIWRGDDPNEMGDNLPPVDLGTGRTAVALASGSVHTCALLDDDSVKCWGKNNSGQLGLGDTADRGDDPNEMGDHLPVVRLMGDLTPPVCRLDAVDAGPPATIKIFVRDANPGVYSVEVLKAKNIDIEIVNGSGHLDHAGDMVTFEPLNSDDILISATKVDQSASSVVALRITDGDGNQQSCDPVYATVAPETPTVFRLEENYPNPFNPTTIIPFDVAETGRIKLIVYDAIGREVTWLVDQVMVPGSFHVTWDGRSTDGSTVESGIYFYKMTSGSFSATQSMVMLR